MGSPKAFFGVLAACEQHPPIRYRLVNYGSVPKRVTDSMFKAFQREGKTVCNGGKISIENYVHMSFSQSPLIDFMPP